MPPSNKFMQLLKDNAQAKARAPFRAEVKGGEATLYLYDVIVSDDYFGGVAAEAFVKELRALDADVIHLRINSPGGDVFAARAMEAAIRECPKKTVAHVDGYAASAASYVALACDEVEIAQGGFFMIHKAWTVGWGNSDDLLATAALLEKIDDTLADTYVTETGQKKDEIVAMMAAETWLTSKEAVDLGFADRVAEAAPKMSAAGWNLAAYANAPAPAAEQPEETPVADTPEPKASEMEAPVASAFDEVFFENLNARLRTVRANRR